MLIAMFFLMRPAIQGSIRVNPVNRYLTLIMIFIFMEFSFWGSDWFHLSEQYQDIMKSQAPMESIYFWIANNLSPNDYLQFRFIIWGGSTSLFLITIKRLKLKFDVTIFFFVSCWLIWFSFGRFSLALSLACFSLTLIYKPIKPKIISYFLGGILLWYSYYFHRSALFVIFIIILTILSGIFSRKFMIIFLISIVFWAYISLDTIYTWFINLLLSYDDLSTTVERGQMYMESDDYISGTGYLIGQILEKAPYYLLSFSCLKSKNIKIPKHILVFIRLLLFIVLFASSFYILFNFNMQAIYDRFMKYALVPAAIVFSYFYSTGFMIKWHRFVFLIALFGVIYQMTYMLYCSVVLNGW